MPRTSHCVIWSDGGPGSDVCRLEIKQSRVDREAELYEPMLADSRTVAPARIVFMNDLNVRAPVEAAAQAGSFRRHQEDANR